MENLTELRTVEFHPYIEGPWFKLELFTDWVTDARGSITVSYKLSQFGKHDALVLFEGTDYNPSPCHAVDSDESVADLLGFLTLRPGDTDDEYFEEYTPRQLAFCEEHAESLGVYADR